MADLLDRVRRELDARIEQLRPLVGELERLGARRGRTRACGGTRGARSRRPPARAGRRETRAQAGRSLDARPAGRAHAAGSTSGRGDGPHTRARRRETPEQTRRSRDARQAGARKPPAQPRAAGRRPAPRDQTQAKVLAALAAAPGSTTAAVAEAAGIPANTAAATLSRLVKQGRVRRLDEGGYASIEPPAGAAQIGAAPATTDPAAAASGTPDAAAPATPDTGTPR